MTICHVLVHPNLAAVQWLAGHAYEAAIGKLLDSFRGNVARKCP